MAFVLVILPTQWPAIYALVCAMCNLFNASLSTTWDQKNALLLGHEEQIHIEKEKKKKKFVAKPD